MKLLCRMSVFLLQGSVCFTYVSWPRAVVFAYLVSKNDNDFYLPRLDSNLIYWGATEDIHFVFHFSEQILSHDKCLFVIFLKTLNNPVCFLIGSHLKRFWADRQFSFTWFSAYLWPYRHVDYHWVWKASCLSWWDCSFASRLPLFSRFARWTITGLCCWGFWQSFSTSWSWSYRYVYFV